MKILRATWHEVFGLFVDDGMLATQILALVLGVAALVRVAGLPPLLAAIGLIPGCLVILTFSLKRLLKK